MRPIYDWTDSRKPQYVDIESGTVSEIDETVIHETINIQLEEKKRENNSSLRKSLTCKRVIETLSTSLTEEDESISMEDSQDFEGTEIDDDAKFLDLVEQR